jgi:hypothetical protein
MRMSSMANSTRGWRGPGSLRKCVLINRAAVRYDLMATVQPDANKGWHRLFARNRRIIGMDARFA